MRRQLGRDADAVHKHGRRLRDVGDLPRSAVPLAGAARSAQCTLAGAWSAGAVGAHSVLLQVRGQLVRLGAHSVLVQVRDLLVPLGAHTVLLQVGGLQLGGQSALVQVSGLLVLLGAHSVLLQVRDLLAIRSAQCC